MREMRPLARYLVAMRARWWLTIGTGAVLVAGGGGYTAYAYETQTDFGKAEPAPGAIVEQRLADDHRRD